MVLEICMPSSNSVFCINVFVWVSLLFPPTVVACCASQVKLSCYVKGEERFLYMLLRISYSLDLLVKIDLLLEVLVFVNIACWESKTKRACKSKIIHREPNE